MQSTQRLCQGSSNLNFEVRSLVDLNEMFRFVLGLAKFDLSSWYFCLVQKGFQFCYLPPAPQHCFWALLLSMKIRVAQCLVQVSFSIGSNEKFHSCCVWFQSLSFGMRRMTTCFSLSKVRGHFLLLHYRALATKA